MNHAQNNRSVISISPGVAGVASAGTHTVAIDCLGFDAVSIDVCYRSLANTSAPSVVAIRHSDTDGSYTAISGLVQGTDYTLAGVSNTANVNVTRFEIGTKALRRYLQVAVTPSADATANGTNNDIVIAARLTKSELGVDSASDANVTTRVVFGG
jgi:hypothetical protein